MWFGVKRGDVQGKVRGPVRDGESGLGLEQVSGEKCVCVLVCVSGTDVYFGSPL